MKATRRTTLEALEKALTQWENFVFPLIPFLNSASTVSSLAESSISLGSVSQRIGRQQLVCQILQRSRWSRRKKERRYGWRCTTGKPNGGGWISLDSWTSTRMKQWPSTHWPAVTAPWTPRRTTPCPPALSNPKKCPTQNLREWALEVRSLDEYQDREWWKPKGPKKPQCHVSKWKATNGLVVKEIVIGHHREMDVSVLLWVDEGRTLTM